MARALTTSEAVKALFELGIENHRGKRIDDNEFTEPFGKTFINPNPPKKYNTFTCDWYYDTYEGCVFYEVFCDEYADGRSYLSLYRFEGHNGKQIFNYAKVDAKTKKRFMDVITNILK